jgi:hypothetical protein
MCANFWSFLPLFGVFDPPGGEGSKMRYFRKSVFFHPIVPHFTLPIMIFVRLAYGDPMEVTKKEGDKKISLPL